MRVHIQTASTLLMARHAAELLNSLVVLRDGLALAFQEEAGEAYDRFINIMGSDIVEQLSAAGGVLLHGQRWPDFGAKPRDRERYDIAIHMLLRTAPLGDSLELDSLHKGSNIVIFKDVIKLIHNRLRNILSGSRDLLPGRDREGFRETIMQSLDGAAISSSRQQVAAGLIVLGAEDLARVLADMKAEAINVEDEEEDTIPTARGSDPSSGPTPAPT